jgi:hypothetical protein
MHSVSAFLKWQFFAGIVGLVLAGLAQAGGPNILSNSNHAATLVSPFSISLLDCVSCMPGASGCSGSFMDIVCSNLVSNTCVSSGEVDDDDTFGYSQFISCALAATSGSQVFYSADTTNVATVDPPYNLLTSSIGGFPLSIEQQNYSALTPSGVMLNSAGCQSLVRSTDYPSRCLDHDPARQPAAQFRSLGSTTSGGCLLRLRSGPRILDDSKLQPTQQPGGDIEYRLFIWHHRFDGRDSCRDNAESSLLDLE